MQSYDYTHPTNFGDTRVDQGSSYSRVSIELRITRPIINAVVKNVLPILLTTICCSFVFLLSPKLVDSRFQIAIFQSSRLWRCRSRWVKICRPWST